MTCDEATDLLGPYVDDDLPAATRRRIETHLFACRGCAWDAETLGITRSRLREGVGEVVASDAFRARALARLFADNEHLTLSETSAADAMQYRLPITL